MKIGVISDTHLHSCDENLKTIANIYFRDVDLIIHAGDLVHINVLEAFSGKKVMAVCGNMDSITTRKELPDRLVLELDGYSIGVMHGWGATFDLEKKILNELGQVDCIIYGHSHRPTNNRKDGILFFNPGSATDNRFTISNTVGILELGTNIIGRIIDI